MRLLLYDVKAIVYTLVLAMGSYVSGWTRVRSESIVPLGYGYGDVGSTSK